MNLPSKKRGVKMVKLNEKEIKELQERHNLTYEEAKQLWLEDEGYLVNDEVERLVKLAKENKCGAKASAIDKTKKKESKPRTVKVSEEKQMIFENILENLQDLYENVTVLKKNKLIEIKFNEKTFKIDIIETRVKKN